MIHKKKSILLALCALTLFALTTTLFLLSAFFHYHIWIRDTIQIEKYSEIFESDYNYNGFTEAIIILYIIVSLPLLIHTIFEDDRKRHESVSDTLFVHNIFNLFFLLLVICCSSDISGWFLFGIPIFFILVVVWLHDMIIAQKKTAAFFKEHGKPDIDCSRYGLRLLLYSKESAIFHEGRKIIDDIDKIQEFKVIDITKVVGGESVYITKSTGTVGRAIVGGLIAGPLGAVIGGATSSKRTELVQTPRETTHHYFIEIILKNQLKKSIRLPLRNEYGASKITKICNDFLKKYKTENSTVANTAQ